MESSTKENKFYVYALSDPFNRVPFYIGKGCGKRAYSHLKNEKINKDKVKMIDLIRNLGKEPRIDFIAEGLDEKTAYEIENFIIKNSKNYGVFLTNKTGIKIPPSRKGCKLSEETKRKISMSSKNKVRKPLSIDIRKKISMANKGKKGPNKKDIENLSLLKHFYMEENWTKIQICSFFGIGLGSLNRILKENDIKKTLDNFIDFSKRKLPQKTVIL